VCDPTTAPSARSTGFWWCCKLDVHFVSIDRTHGGQGTDSGVAYVPLVKRGRGIVAMLAVVVLVGCGEEHPSSQSSDDTHSVGETQNSSDVSPVASEPASANQSVTTVKSGTVGAMNTSPLVSTATTVRSTDSNVDSNTISVPSVTVTTPIPNTSAVTTVAPVTPCDAVPGATCAGVDLRGQELMFANFQGADLRGAILVGVDLSGADLSGANLTNANLTNANLSESILFGTILTGARLNMANLQYAMWDDSTIWPSGFTPPDF
jgi:hypothetical protein